MYVLLYQVICLFQAVCWAGSGWWPEDGIVIWEVASVRKFMEGPVLLLMIEIPHDFTYQNHRSYGGIVYVGVCMYISMRMTWTIVYGPGLEPFTNNPHLAVSIDCGCFLVGVLVLGAPLLSGVYAKAPDFSKNSHLHSAILPRAPASHPKLRTVLLHWRLLPALAGTVTYRQISGASSQGHSSGTCKCALVRTPYMKPSSPVIRIT